ncbi:phenylalanine--tRNA ligase subunit beta [Candidatus Woesearchaeota archaeon]|nr:phenylalanine--tRNA ligase subunit beta [Candidatus Woesearchaeota archaeon]
MPTITFSLKDLNKLVGKKLSVDEVQELAQYGKGDFEGYNKASDDVKVDFGDTNLPYLWSVEGVARLFKGILGKQKGIPKIKINKSDYKLIVDKSVSNVRPYVAAFVAKGHKINDYLIKQMIELQEKLCENYGRRREKVAIGVYQYGKINFPVYYKATDPESVKFIPLDFRKEMTQQEIVEEHPKGKDYAWILKDAKKYPILIDSKNSVLSFPPIINSATTGKIEEGDGDLFFEATGTSLDAVLLATNIFAQALYERGFTIYSVAVKYPTKTITTPYLFDETIKLKKEMINSFLGLDLEDYNIKRLLEKMQYDYLAGKIKIPPYRGDILHPVDIIEDIAIAYGYDKINELPLTTLTVGSTFKIIEFVDKVRDTIIGLGYQEIISPILTNKEILYKKADIGDFGTVEIENFMSETYSCLRTWILPVLLDVLSKNKHSEYPQKIFEEGPVAVRKGDEIRDYRRIALVSANNVADYTEIRQALDSLMKALNLKYTIEETEHNSFIPGRVGRVIVNGKKVAYIGEISPNVLDNHGLEVPVVGFELNLTNLFESMQ